MSVEPLQLTHRQILIVLTGVMAGMLLAALDQSIVGTALPRIVSELGGLDKLSWVVTAYLLTSTAVHAAVGQDLRPLRPPAASSRRRSSSSCIGSLLAGFVAEHRRS